jgi:hypothetical protein
MLRKYSPGFIQIYNFFKRTFEADILTFRRRPDFEVVYDAALMPCLP